MKRCPKCHGIVENDKQKFCTREGAVLVDEPTVACPKCAFQNSMALESCIKCKAMLPRITFVCYARKDQFFVRDLVSRLKKQGVRVWVDQFDIRVGEDWDQKIDDAIYGCSHFLIVLSPAAIQSHEVRSELRTALDERKCIVPILLETCRMPRQLRSLQHVDFSSHEAEDGEPLRELLNALLG